MLLAVVAACGSGTLSDAGLTPDGSAASDARSTDAGSTPDLGVVADASAADGGGAADGQQASDAGLLADADDDGGAPLDAAAIDDAGATTDAEVGVDAGPGQDAAIDPGDGGFAGADRTCPVPPSRVDGPFSSDPPPATANFLLTDTSSEAVFRLSLTGQVLNTWRTLPVRRPFGVTHDKRTHDGFFVNGGARSINRSDVYRMSFTGAVTATLAGGSINGQIWGMDYLFGSSPAMDLFGYETINTNSIPVIMGRLVTNSTRWLEGGLFQPSNAQWRGFYVERYVCDDGVTILYWTTRDGNVLELRDWGVGAPLRTFTVPGTTNALGLTRTPRGDFYVVDRQNRRVLHLAADLSIIDSFRTPGPAPSDISYDE